MKSIFISRVNILLAIFLMACNSQNDKKLEQALERAKENRQELEKVLDHYKKDSTKLAAARFLIENMPYHLHRNNTIFLPEKKSIDQTSLFLTGSNLSKDIVIHWLTEDTE